MAQVRKLDSRRRAVFPTRFSAGDVFLEEEASEERVIFRLIKKAAAPLVAVKSIDGMLMLQAKADASTIRDAVRADRDER